MIPTSVYLVGKEDLLREGISCLLERNAFSIAAVYSDIHALPQTPVVSENPSLVIMIDGMPSDLAEHVNAIRKSHTNSRIVIISSRTEMPVVLPIFTAGVDGYILKDISCSALLGSLQLVMSGEKVYPTFMLAALSKQQNQPIANDTDNDVKEKTANVPQLSRQEMRIIQCLTNGEPNKIIAHQLNIAEATVKVHVKTILRKLGAKNRTQAALWATAQGLFALPTQLPTHAHSMRMTMQ